MDSSSHSWTRVRDLFLDLVELPPEPRAAALERLRAEDPELAREVEGLLEHDDAPEAADVDSTAQRFGPYVAIERIGAGGMGEVYLARRDDGEFEREVAVKVLREGTVSPDLAARFQRERQTLAALNHESIVRLLDGGTTADGRAYFVMEHVDGVNLDQHARSLPLRDRLELFQRVVQAVAHAHERGVVHRDLKPSNILVRGDGAVRLVDFGIARLLGTDPSLAGDRTLTRTGQRMFTPEYASPEQILGERTSTATDVFALGVILYEFLAQQSPWPAGGTTLDLESAIVAADPTPPSRRATGTRGRAVRGDLDTIALKCLSRSPARRYPDAASLAEDLERHLSGRTIEARRATALERSIRLVRRRPWQTLTLVSTIVAITAGALVLYSNAQEIERQETLRRQLPDRLASVRGLIQARDFDRARSQIEQAADDIATLDVRGPLDVVRLSRSIELALAEGEGERAMSLIESAKKAWATDAPGEPRIATELRYFEASALASLGRMPEAEAAARDVLDGAAEYFPPSHYLRLRSGAILAKSLMQRGELDDASELLESLETSARERGKENDLVLAEIEGLVGRWLREVGKPAEALKRLKSARSTYRWHHGDRHVDVAELTMVIGRVRFETGDADGAWEEIETARAAFRELNSPMMRAYLLELASHVATARRQLPDKIAALDESLENIEANFLPADRAKWCVVQMHRGVTLAALGRIDEAIEAYEAALEIDPESGEPRIRSRGHDLEAQARASFADVLKALGRESEARAQYAEAAKHFEQALGADHPVTRKARELGGG